MNSNRIRTLLTVGIVTIALTATNGCAYYNTFYNIKKDFKAAERRVARAQIEQPPSNAPRPGQPAQGASSAQAYQDILQSCAKLLEYYPNSRWIDDALMIMGVCYFRSDEFARAERKFTELTTIFPNSKHLEQAIVWRAKSLFAQDQLDLAEEVLTTSRSKLKSANAIAAAARTHARINEKREQLEEAVIHLEEIRDISYDRNDKASDYLTLGRAYEKLGRKDDARQALQRSLNMTRNPDEVFEARRIMAAMEASSGNYMHARNILRPLQTDRRFLDRAGEVQVEVANVEAVAGDPRVCIQMLEEFCATAAQGEAKARAYLLQGKVARDKLREYEFAQAKFDSVAGAGASRALQDSARAMSKQLQSGLTALAQIPELESNLNAILLQLAEDEHEKFEGPIIESATDDSTSGAALPSFESPVDSVVTDKEATDQGEFSDVFQDSLQPEVAEVDSVVTQTEQVSQRPIVESDTEITPAQMITDSIMRALAVNDSIRRAEEETFRKQNEPEPENDDSTIVEGNSPAVQNDSSALQQRLESVSVQLVVAHLEAASFYELVVNEPDSALEHTKMAVDVPDSSDEHWRASMQLGLELKSESRDPEAANMQFERIAGSSRAPQTIRNAARAQLGLSPLVTEKSEQELALQRAEGSLMAGQPDSVVIEEYREALVMDSLTHAGIQALHGIAYIQEYRSADYASAMETHKAIVRLFPDSAFVEKSMAKLQVPDTNSVFLMSEEALQATMAPAMDFLNASADSSGWPPEESSLRGRRFQ